MRRIFFEIDTDTYHERFGCPSLRFGISNSSKQKNNLSKIVNRLKLCGASSVCIEDCFPKERADDPEFRDMYLLCMASFCFELGTLLRMAGSSVKTIIVECDSMISFRLFPLIRRSWQPPVEIVLAEKLDPKYGYDPEYMLNRLECMEPVIDRFIFVSEKPCSEIEELLDVFENYPYDVYFQNQRIL